MIVVVTVVVFVVMEQLVDEVGLSIDHSFEFCAKFFARVAFFWGGVLMFQFRRCLLVDTLMCLSVKEGNSCERIELVETAFVQVVLVPLLFFRIDIYCLLWFVLWHWVRFILDCKLVEVSIRIGRVVVDGLACRTRSVSGVVAENPTVKTMSLWSGWCSEPDRCLCNGNKSNSCKGSHW